MMCEGNQTSGNSEQRWLTWNTWEEGDGKEKEQENIMKQDLIENNINYVSNYKTIKKLIANVSKQQVPN